MKIAILIVVAVVILTLAAWMVFGAEVPNSRFLVPLVIAVFVLPPLGGWWLVFTVIRHEKPMFPIIFLAVVPYGFVWYYFERVRSGRYRS